LLLVNNTRTEKFVDQMRLGENKRKQDRCARGRREGRKRVMMGDKKILNLTGSTRGKNIIFKHLILYRVFLNP
jgi:hypothetical protein